MLLSLVASFSHRVSFHFQSIFRFSLFLFFGLHTILERPAAKATHNNIAKKAPTQPHTEEMKVDRKKLCEYYKNINVWTSLVGLIK